MLRVKKKFFSKITHKQKKCIFAASKARGVAQLVARYVRDVEAASSSLVTPTFFYPSFKRNV